MDTFSLLFDLGGAAAAVTDVVQLNSLGALKLSLLIGVSPSLESAMHVYMFKERQLQTKLSDPLLVDFLTQILLKFDFRGLGFALKKNGHTDFTYK